MHHGDEQPSEEFRKIMRELQGKEDKRLKQAVEKIAAELELGATHHYPEGALNETDEGEIKIAVGVQDGKVILTFGKPVAWMGFSPRQARQLAESLRKVSHRITD